MFYSHRTIYTSTFNVEKKNISLDKYLKYPFFYTKIKRKRVISDSNFQISCKRHFKWAFYSAEYKSRFFFQIILSKSFLFASTNAKFLVIICRIDINFRSDLHQPDFSPRFPLERIDPGHTRIAQNILSFMGCTVARERLSNAFYPIKKRGKSERNSARAKLGREKRCARELP